MTMSDFAWQGTVCSSVPVSRGAASRCPLRAVMGTAHRLDRPGRCGDHLQGRPTVRVSFLSALTSLCNSAAPFNARFCVLLLPDHIMTTTVVAREAAKSEREENGSCTSARLSAASPAGLLRPSFGVAGHPSSRQSGGGRRPQAQRRRCYRCEYGRLCVFGADRPPKARETRARAFRQSPLLSAGARAAAHGEVELTATR